MYGCIFGILLVYSLILLKKGKLQYLNLRPGLKKFEKSLTNLYHALFKPSFSRPKKLIFFLILLTAIVRLCFINQPMRYDKAATSYYFVNVHLAKSFFCLEPINHVLQTLSAKFFIELFGNHPATLRFPALLAGILCLQLIFLISKRFFLKSLRFCYDGPDGCYSNNHPFRHISLGIFDGEFICTNGRNHRNVGYQ